MRGKGGNFKKESFSTTLSRSYIVFTLVSFVTSAAFDATYNASQKHKSTLLDTYALNKFLTDDRFLKQNIFESTLIKAGSSHLQASFSIFCVQIGQLFEAQRHFQNIRQNFRISFNLSQFFLAQNWLK